MSLDKTPKKPSSEPAVVAYSLVCLGAVGVTCLTLAEKGAQNTVLIPLVIGLAGVALRWRSAPVLFLVGLVFVHLQMRWVGWYSWYEAQLGLADCVAAAAVLAYVAAHYRLQGLVGPLLAPEPRPPGRRKDRPAVPRRGRSPVDVAGSEFIHLLLALPIWVSVAVIAWLLLPGEFYPRGFHGYVWRLLVLTWVLILGSLVVTGLFGYLGWQRMTPTEARLFLQDISWQETRREQGRINRWLGQTLHGRARGQNGQGKE